MIVYIYSKQSRNGNNKNIEYISSKLKDIYPDILIYSFDEIDTIDKENTSKVIFSGGDGSFHRIINYFKDYLNKITFGLIPTGTANDIGKNFKIKSIDEAISIITTNNIKEESLLDVSGELTLYALSVGEMSRVSIDAKGETKKRFGKLIYKIKGIRYLFTKKKVININDKFYKLKVLIILRSLYLGGVKIGKDIDDNIHMYLIRNIFDVINLFIFNRFLKIKGVICNNINVESDSIWCVDGEKIDISKGVITLSKKKIKMLSKKA